MIWWLVGGIAAAVLLRHLWMSYNHPAFVLCRQAANMHWRAAGHIRDESGLRNMRFSHGGKMAEVSHRHGHVLLVDPRCDRPFGDFVELERWLASSAGGGATEVEAQLSVPGHEDYYAEIGDYIAKQGGYETVLTLQGSDEEFCRLSMEMWRAACLSGRAAVMAGAHTLQAAKHYEENPELAIEYLRALSRSFSKPAN